MLPSRNRLKKNSDITRVLRLGSRVQYGDFLFIFLKTDGQFRFTSIVRKKEVRLATVRNLIRRIISETIRQFIPIANATGDLVVISNLRTPDDLRNQFLLALKRWQSEQ